MDTGNENCQSIMEHLPDALACHRIIFDSLGHPVDCILCEVNAAFEQMVDSDREHVLGRPTTEIIPGMEEVFRDWIATIDYASSSKQSVRRKEYLKSLGGMYEVVIYGFEPGYFVTLFRDTAEDKDAVEPLEMLWSQIHDELGKSSAAPDFQRMTNDLLALSGAKFVAVNTYEQDGTKTVTRAISGIHWGILRASEIMGFDLIGKVWDVIPERKEAIREGRLIRFDALYDAASGAVPKRTTNVLEKLFDIGLVYVVELSYQEESLGDFILFMPRGRALRHPNIIELYANQSAIIILRNRAQRALRSKEEEFRTLAENSPDLITRLDRKCRRMYANPAVAEVLGVPVESLMGKTNRDLGLEDSLTHVWEEAAQEVFQTGQARSLELSRQVGSERKYYLIRLVPEFDDEGEVATVLSISRDITERKLSEQYIRWISFHDGLTGLYNRRFLEEEMRRLDTEQQLPLSVIIADLNGLKLVNDSFGHATGDEMIQTAGEIIQSACRSEDIVGRQGGDEFLVILPRTGARETESIVAQITRLSENARTEAGIPISFTMGQATKRRTEQRLEDILIRAEDEMYERKLVESRTQRNSITDMLLETVANKSFETREHVLRMQQNAIATGEAMGLSSLDLDRLALAVELHDVGEIIVPEEVLRKSGPLSEEEWQTIRKHPEVGYRIARSTDSFSHVAEIILHHHERWDGKGYPVGLAGERIPLLARVIAVVDAFDAMTHSRPYRSVVSKEEALRELRRCAGSQFDPEVVEIFSRLSSDAESADSTKPSPHCN